VILPNANLIQVSDYQHLINIGLIISHAYLIHLHSVTEQCIADCGINIGCQAACVGVPNPGSKHIRETNACIKECLRTTNADTFPACQDRCISENFMAVNIERTVTTVKEDDNKTEDNNDTDTNAEEAEEASSGMSTSSVQSTAAVAFVAGMLAALFFI
jgi:hypothetical protein